VVEERVDRRVRGLQQSTSVRRRGAPPRGAAPALDDDHRLGRGQPPADLRKALGIPERLEIQENDVGAAVLLPEAHEVVARHVSLVAHRDERREAEAPARGVVERGDPVGAAPRSARDAARPRTTRRERGVHLPCRGRVEHTEAVRPDEPHARLPADAKQLRLPRLALRAVFAEAAREHHERANTFELAFPRDVHHKRRGDGDDGHFHRSGDVCNGCVGSPAGDPLGVRVDRIDRPAERASHEIPDDRPADAHPPA
jgi:hypothetical protein